MKITKLTTYRLPPRWLFLKIETDEGVVGWGEPVIEGRARTVEAAVHELGEYLTGHPPILQIFLSCFQIIFCCFFCFVFFFFRFYNLIAKIRI